MPDEFKVKTIDGVDSGVVPSAVLEMRSVMLPVVLVVNGAAAFVGTMVLNCKPILEILTVGIKIWFVEPMVYVFVVAGGKLTELSGAKAPAGELNWVAFNG